MRARGEVEGQGVCVCVGVCVCDIDAFLDWLRVYALMQEMAMFMQNQKWGKHARLCIRMDNLCCLYVWVKWEGKALVCVCLCVCMCV